MSTKNLGKIFILFTFVQAIAFSLAGFLGLLLLEQDAQLKSFGGILYAGVSSVEIVCAGLAIFLGCCFIDMATGKKPWVGPKKVWALSIGSSLFWLVDTFSMYMSMSREVIGRLAEHQANFFYSLFHSEITLVFMVEAVFVAAFALGIRGWRLESSALVPVVGEKGWGAILEEDASSKAADKPDVALRAG